MTLENRRVVITGLGAITPIGNTVKEYWEGLLAGKNGIDHITKFDTKDFTVRIAGEVKNFKPEDHLDRKELKKFEEFVVFAVVAAREAFNDAGLKPDGFDHTRAGAMIGSGIGGLRSMEEQHKVFLEKGPRRISPFLIIRMIVNMAAGYVAIDLGLKGPNTVVSTACATGTHSIGDAFKTIQRGAADIMFAGGAEGAITPLGIGGFAAMKALSERNDEPARSSRPFDVQRDGFIMSEGAAVVVLEELEHARHRGARIYAEIVGYGLSDDAYHITAPDPNGDGGARGMKAALDDAGIKPEEIDYINAHGTSTPLNDKLETQAIKTVFGDHAYKLLISSNKSMIGHLLGAAGAAETVSTVLTLYHDIIPPTMNYEYPDPACDLNYVPNKAQKATVRKAINNSLGFGGHNCTIALQKFSE